MLKNMKIGRLLLTTFIVVSLIASISGITSTFLMGTIDKQYSFALVNYGFSQGDIGKTMCAYLRTRVALRDIVGFTNSDDIEEAKIRLDTYSEQVNTNFQKLESIMVSQTEKDIYNQIKIEFPAYLAKSKEVLALGGTTDPIKSEQAQVMIVNELDPLFDSIYDQLSSLMDETVTVGNQLSTDLTALSRASVGANVTLVCVSFFVSILIAVFITKGIVRPLREVETATVKMAEGNLDVQIEYVSNNEFGVLAEKSRALNSNLKEIIYDMNRGLGEMAQGNFDIVPQAEFKGDFIPLRDSIHKIIVSLSDTLGQISQSADQVSAGSNQVSSGAQALAQGTTEQASSIEELASTISEFSQQITENANNALKVSENANSVGMEAAESNKRMKNMLMAMSDISNRSNEIAKIIKTIEDIAFQTNILALNAAVEAARAGTAGKGFAVVADEVRNLASKSAEASKNTAVLIEGSLQAVENGTKIADETAQSLSTVVDGIKDVTITIGKISEVSAEQADSISQVTIGIDQISSVVQTNSATAEESAAASEELSAQARMLKELVYQFKLKK